MPRPEFPADQDNPFSAESKPPRPERPILDPIIVAIVSAYVGSMVALNSNDTLTVRATTLAVGALAVWVVVHFARPPRR